MWRKKECPSEQDVQHIMAVASDIDDPFSLNEDQDETENKYVWVDDNDVKRVAGEAFHLMTTNSGPLL